LSVCSRGASTLAAAALVDHLGDQIVSVLSLSLAVATVSMTMTKAKVSKPLRARIKARSAWWGEVFSCPYCFSHYVSPVAVAVWRPVLVSCGFYPADLLISVLVIIALAALGCGLIYRSISVIPADLAH
jgi:hypothetical protein